MSERTKNGPAKIIPFYAVRVGDLFRPVAVLSAVCEACHTMRDIDPMTLARSAGPDVTLRELSKHLKCNECGAKGGVRFELKWISEQGA